MVKQQDANPNFQIVYMPHTPLLEDSLQNNHHPHIFLSSHMKNIDEGIQIKIMLKSNEWVNPNLNFLFNSAKESWRWFL